jgi:hypothetical protein
MTRALRTGARAIVATPRYMELRERITDATQRKSNV